MNFGAINWFAVIVCTLVILAIGATWFNPKTFFPMWWKAMGKSNTDAPGMPGGAGLTWGLVVLSAFVQALFMSLMVTAMGSMTAGGATLGSGALAGFVLWLGFVAPTSLTNKIFEGHLKAWAIEAGNHLLNFIVIGAILGAWH